LRGCYLYFSESMCSSKPYKCRCMGVFRLSRLTEMRDSSSLLSLVLRTSCNHAAVIYHTNHQIDLISCQPFTSKAIKTLTVMGAPSSSQDGCRKLASHL
jgi:hypothetical protein